jgi:hypothetical protein
MSGTCIPANTRCDKQRSSIWGHSHVGDEVDDGAHHPFRDIPCEEYFPK